VHVFIDDSGDPGMKLGGGSSRYLVMAARVFQSDQAMEDAAAAIAACRRRLGRPDGFEFKHAKTTRTAKDAFFTAVGPADFAVRAIIIDKTILYSGGLVSDCERLHRFAITQLLTHTRGTVRDAKVVIDGKDSKAFAMTSATYFRRLVNAMSPGTVRVVSYADSARNSLVQLADMMAGAIHRSERDRRPETLRHMAVVRGKAKPPRGSLWSFGGGGGVPS
jgi:hypothetical protein